MAVFAIGPAERHPACVNRADGLDEVNAERMLSTPLEEAAEGAGG
jgi:hypothetical protein